MQANSQQSPKQRTILDALIIQFDQALRSNSPGVLEANRPTPGGDTSDQLDINSARHAAGLMRVNHSGEICAQALYSGQAFTAKLPIVKQEMKQAAEEEQDHLVWCNTRLRELSSHTSVFNPLWYGLSFTLGAAAGLLGDKYSLGFVAETEAQVGKHLTAHLATLPIADNKSRAILTQMYTDEMKHREQALAAGGAELPAPVKRAMTVVSKVMTTLSYYL